MQVFILMLLIIGLLISAPNARADGSAKVAAAVTELRAANPSKTATQFMDTILFTASRVTQEIFIAQDPDYIRGIDQSWDMDFIYERVLADLVSGIAQAEEEDRKKRCAANKRLFEAFTCNTRPTIKPVDTSQLQIPSSNQRVNLWGPAALGLATRSFDGALNLNDFQRGLREGLDYCKEDQPCISEVLIYFGVNEFPTYNSITDFLNWAYSYVASQTFGPNVYSDSAAGRMASRWELGAACDTLRQANKTDSCTP